MRFLADENIPKILIKTLIERGHDVTDSERNKSDVILARRALAEKRIILTLDKDLTNTILFPPARFNILHIDIHPPEKNVITDAVVDLISKLKPSNFKGLIILTKEGFIRYTK